MKILFRFMNNIFSFSLLSLFFDGLRPEPNLLSYLLKKGFRKYEICKKIFSVNSRFYSCLISSKKNQYSKFIICSSQYRF